MKEFDPKHAAENGYTKADWDAIDAPELTDDELATARPFTEAMPELTAKLRRVGRPKSENPKRAVSIRLDADLAEALRASGKGWQSRANDILRKAVGLNPTS